MATSRPANKSEKERWDQWVDKARAINLRWNAMNNLREQAMIATSFANKQGWYAPPITQAVIAMSRQKVAQLKIERIINDVFNGKIGIQFPNGITGDIDVLSFDYLNEDELAQYQFSGILVIIGGAMIISGLIMKASGLWDEDPDIERDLETCKKFVEQKAAQDPKLSADWEKTKADKDWQQRQTMADRLRQQAVELWEKAEGPISQGISMAIPIIAGILILSWAWKKR